MRQKDICSVYKRKLKKRTSPQKTPWTDLKQILHSESPRRPNHPRQFLAIGLGVLNLWWVEFCHFPISRRSPLTQCWCYRAACDDLGLIIIIIISLTRTNAAW